MKYTLVTQGYPVYETENRQEAIDIAVKENKSWLKYKQKCLDEGERYADNEMFVYDEDGNEIDLSGYYRAKKPGSRGEER